MQGVGRSGVLGVLAVLSFATAIGCNTPEEKALAQERVDLVKLEASIVERTPTDCKALTAALGEFEKANSQRITTFNTKWTALPEKKRESLMKPLRKDSNPAFKTLITPLVQCGAIFPVK